MARAADCNPQEVSNAYWCVDWILKLAWKGITLAAHDAYFALSGLGL